MKHPVITFFSYSVSVLFFLCTPAVLPLCVLNNFSTETTNYKQPTRGSQTQRITLNTSIHYTLHIYTPVLLCFVLFCFVSPFKVCVSSVRDLPHPARTYLTKQNMSVTGRIWKHGKVLRHTASSLRLLKHSNIRHRISWMTT